MNPASEPAEFPTLDLDELEPVPLHAAAYVSTIEHDELPQILAADLPTVAHARRALRVRADLHEFIDTSNGAAVRYLLRIDERGRIHADIAEAGPAGLWDRIVAACTRWEDAGRPT